jgi:hypothetical protein
MKGTFPTRPCANAPTCDRPARGNVFATSGFSTYCERCRQRARRHGDPRQAPLRKPEVSKYSKRIERLLKKRGSWERIETYLRETASLLADVVQDPEYTHPLAADGKCGIWVNRWRQRARDEVLKVLGDADAVQSGIMVAAVFLLRDLEPRRFVTDRAFESQLVRLWRSQTRLSFGSFYNVKTDKTVSTYRDLPPKVVAEIALLLVATFTRFAGNVVAAFHKDLARRAARKENLTEGFAPLLADWSQRVSSGRTGRAT